MNKILKVLLLIWLSINALCYSQDFSTLWQSHYSYNNIVDVVHGPNKTFAAAQNAIFEYDVVTQEMKTITTVEGLSGQEISTIYYSQLFQYLIIGYNTGLIEIYSETDESVLTVVDILEKDNITPANKRINHFFEYEGLVYVSTDYGISVYDLERLEFGDTFFLGNGGSQIIVAQTTVLNNRIFAACKSNNGIKSASLDNPNLVDFQQWDQVLPGNYFVINTLNENVYTVRGDRRIYEIDSDNSWNFILQLDSRPIDSEVNQDQIVYSSSDEVLVFDSNFQLLNMFFPTVEYDTDFSSATIIDGFVYIGTTDFGVLRANINNNSLFDEIKPNGPLFNEIFRVSAESEIVYATFGDYSESFNPFPLRSRGYSYYLDEDQEWRNIPFDSVLGARNLSEISFNPFNPSQVFISSCVDGILEVNNFESTILYDQDNSGLESLISPSNPNAVSIRVTASTFDREGVLWSLSARAPNPLKSYDPSTGNWQGYDFSAIIEDAFSDEFGFFDIAVDNNGTKWIGGYSNGLYAFNENIGPDPLKNITSEEQNLPFPRVTSLEVDSRNQLWVGTFNGLRVLFNTSGFFDDPNPTLSSIIILEDGIPKELLEGQTISDIEADGSNNKWVGTVDSGVFYFSPDGQNTIYHFTAENSPLPSNRINDISIDPNNGIVYIATIKGMLSFRAGGSKPQETLENAFVYPNPVRPEYDLLGYNDLNDINKGIKVSGLTERVNIKITDVEGNLVTEAQSNVNLRSSNSNYNFAIDGGTAIWNGKNLANQVVRSGVYLIMISDLDSFETKVLKVLIVR